MREILLVEDNEIIVKGLKYLLEQEKFDIKIAKNIVEAKTMIKKQKFDLYLLDITLPDGDGYEICQYVKKQKDVPVIFLTAKDEELNVVQCLDMGADDYIIKPFSTRELIARINRIALKGDQHLVIKVKDIEFDIDKMVVLKNSVEINLTSLELKILHLLFVNLNKVVKRDEIIESIWEWTGNDVNDNTVTVYLKRIRKKLDTDIIKTIKGIGYRIDVN